MITSFWSPNNHMDSIRGLLTLSLQQSIKMKKEQLIINVSQDNVLDKLILGNSNINELLEFRGVNGLLKLDKLQDYKRESIEMISLTYLNNNYHYIPGSNKKVLQPQVTSSMIKEVRKSYDNVILDLPVGNNTVSKSMMLLSDLIVVCLPQNKVEIESFLENYKMQNEKVYFLITDYNNESSYNLKNLSRKYLCFKNKITAIPYNINFLDAIYESKAMGYMQKLNINENSFIKTIDKASNLILNEWGKEE